MDEELDRYEKKVARLVTRVFDLKKENAELRKRLATALAELRKLKPKKRRS